MVGTILADLDGRQEWVLTGRLLTMFDLSGFIPPLPLRIRIMDFHTRCESMHTRLEWEERRTLLGASDISFVVNAPLEYLADEDGADSVLFIDQVQPNCLDLRRPSKTAFGR